MEENKNAEPQYKAKFFAKSAVTEYTKNPWTDVRTLYNKKYDFDKFVKDVNYCRFFYKTEPVVSTVINKLAEIGINDLVLSRNGLPENQFRLFEAIKQDLLDFAESMAIEYLLSGLVVPEFTFKKVDKDFLMSFGIKKSQSMKVPDTMWLRDPKTIKIETGISSDKPVYLLKIPEEMIKFIKNKGKYESGAEDKELYEGLKKEYPELVKAVNAGKTEIPLENRLVIRRKFLADNPYPIPYVNASLEALEHKRKLRRIDYSIIDKVISAIMHVKIGSDDFPVTDSPEDKEYVTDITNQLQMRATVEQNLERIFQLITNHTVEINWIFPDVQILLDNKKYQDINQEILFGLGFPRILITGESERSGSSDPEMAMIAPLRTMQNFRGKIIQIVQEICKQIALENNFSKVPLVYFKEINMHKFSDFLTGLTKLYEISALSRTEFARVYGYDFQAQLEKLEEEQKEIEARGLPQVGLSPFSSPQLGNQPNNNQNNKNQDKPENNPSNQNSSLLADSIEQTISKLEAMSSNSGESSNMIVAELKKLQETITNTSPVINNYVNTPDITASINVEPTPINFSPNIEPSAVETKVESATINFSPTINVEPTPIENKVEPTPVNFNPTVNVEPTPIENKIENKVEVKTPKEKKRVTTVHRTDNKDIDSTVTNIEYED